MICCVLNHFEDFSSYSFFIILELTEFPKIDPSDDEDETEKTRDDNEEVLSQSISSISMDGLSLNNPSGMLNHQPTSDYESFADCMRQSPSIISAHANNNARSLTNINFDNHFSIQPSIQVNAEDRSSVNNDQQRKRKHGLSSTINLRQNGKTITNNETPLLSHLFGTHKINSDF